MVHECSFSADAKAAAAPFPLAVRSSTQVRTRGISTSRANNPASMRLAAGIRYLPSTRRAVAPPTIMLIADVASMITPDPLPIASMIRFANATSSGGGLNTRFEDWYLALAAYNWGPGNVQRALAHLEEYALMLRVLGSYPRYGTGG